MNNVYLRPYTDIPVTQITFSTVPPAPIEQVNYYDNEYSAISPEIIILITFILQMLHF